MTEEPQFRGVSAVRFAIPSNRSDLLLVQLRTRQGLISVSLNKRVALELAKGLNRFAGKLTPNRSAH
jgi:hypothetical protein